MLLVGVDRKIGLMRALVLAPWLLLLACAPPPADGQCSDDVDCPAGQVCNLGRQVCVPLDAGARADAAGDDAIAAVDATGPHDGSGPPDGSGHDVARGDASLPDGSGPPPDASPGSDGGSSATDAAQARVDAFVAADAAGVDVRGPEICDGLDNDGVGGIDDGLTPPSGLCEQRGVCAGMQATCTGATGWRCLVQNLPYYEAVEHSCDGLDNDCDGLTDEDLAPPAICEQRGVCAGTVASCGGSAGWQCSYTSPHYQAVEADCDGLDNDCDGLTDEDLAPPAICKQRGVCAGTVASCGGSAGWQCSYTSPHYQAVEDACDSRDNDCDGATDECPATLDCHASVSVCTPVLDIDYDGDSLSERLGDCRPRDAQVRPGLDDLVDQKDNDCDGFVDEYTDGEGAPITALRSYVAATLQPAGEYDYWRVDLPAGTYHARVVAYPQQTADLVVSLHDASGTLVGAAVDAQAVGGFEILPLSSSGAGALFVGVHSKGTTTGPYRIAIYPGAYDPRVIAGGDGEVLMPVLPTDVLLVGATATDPDAFGNVVSGDDIYTLTLGGAFAPVSNYRIPNLVIRDLDLSPSRQRIAFTANWNAGRFDVYVLDLVAQRTHRLTPDALPCPANYGTLGFGHPSFVGDSSVVFIGECVSQGSIYAPEVDVLLRAPADGSSAATTVTLAGNGCYQPLLVPRAGPGVDEVAVSSNGCAINIAGETTTGGRISRYSALTGQRSGDLGAAFGPTPGTHHKLAGWDLAATTYAVAVQEGVLEFATSDGAFLRGWQYSVARPASSDYWNRETLTYAPGGGRVAYLRWNVDQYFDVYVLDLGTGAWTAVSLDMAVRRGAAW